ncbi:MAG: hypothetical protein P4M11_02915, partial [Candidatus Pacebacteria bacterium]|nr:hypothetical protein [Candidatus Paceibacterota bacterium]
MFILFAIIKLYTYYKPPHSAADRTIRSCRVTILRAHRHFANLQPGLTSLLGFWGFGVLGFW